MKPRPTICLMMAAALAGFVIAYLSGREYFGFFGLVVAAMPIVSMMAGEALWKPWFLEDVDVEPPDVSIFAIQAIVIEIAIAICIAHGTGDTVFAARIVVLIIQFATIGKFRRDHGTSPDQPHEISRKSVTGTVPRHPRKP